jgi:hypothetical protein
VTPAGLAFLHSHRAVARAAFQWVPGTAGDRNGL